MVKFVLFCTATSGRILRKLVVSFNDSPDANLQLLSSTLLLPVLTCIASFDSQLYPLTKLAFYEPKGSERTAHKTKTHVSSMSSFDETMGNSLSYDDDGDESDESPHRHTQFLDLTNGEGGDQTNFYEDEDDGGGGGDEDEAAASSTASKPAACDKINPNTPGKVVETGQEHTGRWTREEHAAFLSALKQYGKEWKKVAAKVKTRTVVQTRTHAQKYFQKLQKALQTNASKGGTVEMGVDSRQKALALKKKQQQQQQYQQKKPPIIRSQSTASTHAAAHLMTNLASGASGDIPSPPVKFAPNTSSFGTGAPYSTAQISAPSFTTHGFSSANNSHNDQPLLAPQSIPSYPGGFFGRSGVGACQLRHPSMMLPLAWASSPNRHQQLLGNESWQRLQQLKCWQESWEEKIKTVAVTSHLRHPKVFQILARKRLLVFQVGCRCKLLIQRVWVSLTMGSLNGIGDREDHRRRLHGMES